VAAEASVGLLQVNYHCRYNGTEVVSVIPRGTVELISVEDIGP